ncbi:CGNR zinc finger domain-containing protein [Streptomyces sp. NPDC041068]|uniref:CGNR zinc finger domain-containing protein n=1 Tax=Streptomyces sp. NPDC041068 TaxID=3155130 RepID=UPI0033DF25E0
MPPHRNDWSTPQSVSAVARRSADLVNVLSGEETRPDTVAALLREYGGAGFVEVSDRDLTELRTAALRLREVFAADHVDAAAAALNGLLARGTGALRLTSHGGAAPWHPHLDGDDDAPWGEWFLASACMALTVLVWDTQRAPGGICASPCCPNVYLAQGSGAARRYCSRRCATRERVAAHRRAARAAGA